MSYLHWNEKVITGFEPHVISDLYDQGYVFTRKGKGVMQQTRSVRIDLNQFNLSSENRRILKKTEEITLTSSTVPVTDYNFALGKLAKDFYETKFGPGVMSAQKIKEMLTDAEKSNFNSLFVYSTSSGPIGYSICYSSPILLHYSYPFYDLEKAPKEMGMGMMVRAIEHAKESGMKYIYLGSLQRPGDVYKLQFEGLEWFDGKEWKKDIEEAKRILTLPVTD